MEPPGSQAKMQEAFTPEGLSFSGGPGFRPIGQGGCGLPKRVSGARGWDHAGPSTEHCLPFLGRLSIAFPGALSVWVQTQG